MKAIKKILTALFTLIVTVGIFSVASISNTNAHKNDAFKKADAAVSFTYYDPMRYVYISFSGGWFDISDPIVAIDVYKNMKIYWSNGYNNPGWDSNRFALGDFNPVVTRVYINQQEITAIRLNRPQFFDTSTLVKRITLTYKGNTGINQTDNFTIPTYIDANDYPIIDITSNYTSGSTSQTGSWHVVGGVEEKIYIDITNSEFYRYDSYANRAKISFYDFNGNETKYSLDVSRFQDLKYKGYGYLYSDKRSCILPVSVPDDAYKIKFWYDPPVITSNHNETETVLLPKYGDDKTVFCIDTSYTGSTYQKVEWKKPPFESPKKYILTILIQYGMVGLPSGLLPAWPTPCMPFFMEMLLLQVIFSIQRM